MSDYGQERWQQFRRMRIRYDGTRESYERLEFLLWSTNRLFGRYVRGYDYSTDNLLLLNITPEICVIVDIAIQSYLILSKGEWVSFEQNGFGCD